MEFREVEKDLEAVQSRGHKVAALDNKPRLRPEAIPYWTAYCEIGRGRRRDSGGPLPISPVEVESWLNLRGWTDTDVRMMVFEIVSIVDASYLEKFYKKIERKDG